MSQIKLTNTPEALPNLLGESQAQKKLRDLEAEQHRKNTSPQISVYTSSVTTSTKQFFRAGFQQSLNAVHPASVGQWAGAFAFLKPEALQIGTLLDLNKVLVANFDVAGIPAFPAHSNSFSTKLYLTTGITDANNTSPYFTPLFSWEVGWLDYIHTSNQFKVFNLERSSDQIYQKFNISRTLTNNARADYFENGRDYLDFQYLDLIENGKAIAYTISPNLSAVTVADSNWFVLNVDPTQIFFLNINLILNYTGIKSLN